MIRVERRLQHLLENSGNVWVKINCVKPNGSVCSGRIRTHEVCQITHFKNDVVIWGGTIFMPVRFLDRLEFHGERTVQSRGITLTFWRNDTTPTHHTS